jgi:hypothetical protein
MVLEPESLRNDIRLQAEAMLANYGDNGIEIESG